MKWIGFCFQNHDDRVIFWAFQDLNKKLWKHYLLSAVIYKVRKSRRQQWVYKSNYDGSITPRISIWFMNVRLWLFQECYPRGTKREGYLFSKSWGKSAFLGVSASELKNLKILASNSKNSQSSDVVKMTNAKNDFFDKKIGFGGEIFDITLK